MSLTTPTLETRVTATLALTEADWTLATWRPRTPRPHAVVLPFDRDHCLSRLRRVAATQLSYTAPDWSRAALADQLTAQEAHFWFLAMTDLSREVRQGSLLKDLERHSLSGEIAPEEVRQRLRQRAGFLPAQIVVTLANLFSPTVLIELLLDDQLCVIDPYSVPHYQVTTLQHSLLDGFRHHVRPYLEESTLQQMQQVARQRIPSSLWTQATAPTLEQVMGYRLAPLLHLHRELAMLVTTWPDHLFPARGSYEEWRRMPREMVFGLGDPWLVEQQTRRLKLYCRSDAEGRAWLAHTETKALDWLVTSIREASNYGAHKLIEVLCLVQAPAAAAPLLELRLSGQSCPALRSWFETQVGNAVAGLLPAAGGRGKFADAARQYLREVKRRGGEAILEAQLPSVEPATARRVRTAVLDFAEVEYPSIDEATSPPWLHQALMQLPQLPPGDLPDWLVLDDLPPLVVNGRALTRGHLRTVIRAVEACKLDAPALLLTALRDHVEATYREAFAWAILEQWRCSGASSRDEWVLHTVGFLGEEESALQLETMVREATGATGRRRAVRALDCLAAIGSSLALQQLGSLGRQLRSRPIREYARQLVEALARKRGISRSELEDWAVPTLGFDGERGPVFDFGSRRFEAILASGPRLLVRDGQGTIRDELPTPGVRDDAFRARQAIAEWRLLRKTLKEAIKEQAARLERSMSSGQRWALRHFRERVLAQPLLSHLARLLLWGGYDDRGRLACTFRVTEEGTFADVEENPVLLRDVNSVRVVHPIELTEPQRQSWETVWRDHELIAPFAQLGRRLFRLTDEQQRATVLTAYRGRRVPALTLAGQVKSRDWEATLVGVCREGEAHRKTFRVWDLTAVLHHRNVGEYQYPNHRAEQELYAAYFFRGIGEDELPYDPVDALPLGEVPDLPRSEVQELLALLYSKGKE